MKLSLNPNKDWEKQNFWIIARPDYSAKLRSDIVVKKTEGIKTFENLYITPASMHHILSDKGNSAIEKFAAERRSEKDWDEQDADDDGNAI